ncbi:MAG: hypothetical protein HY876_00455 [Coriobacteriales bacterium]|nr:hypothetical protein [Coriobacteriales bacterium]
MAGRTRLYQQAKSPLIQGQSKHERPAWQPWLGATILAGVIAAPLGVAVALLILDPAALTDESRFLSALIGAALDSPITLLVGLLVAAAGAGLAVWFSSRMGWQRRFVGSLLFAGVLATGAVATLLVVTT